MSDLSDLQDELVEIKAEISKARKAMKLSSGNGSVERGYQLLMQDRKDIEKRIARLQGLRPRVSAADFSGSSD